MKYDQLVESLTEIVNNPNIIKTGLSLTYSLPEKNHKQMNEEFFYKVNKLPAVPVLSDVFEVQIGGIVVKFIKDEKVIE